MQKAKSNSFNHLPLIEIQQLRYFFTFSSTGHRENYNPCPSVLTKLVIQCNCQMN
ncbi:unnamed protein product [Moneuplotes crassus]|uniref:Uncharacterized protein n=1 Tax=Euplotes crassus TaxID=5936 RepID=A0AAD1X3D5_EUPCR|nr:unnamed protein product [Moneuplotes crassus]